MNPSQAAPVPPALPPPDLPAEAIEIALEPLAHPLRLVLPTVRVRAAARGDDRGGAQLQGKRSSARTYAMVDWLLSQSAAEVQRLRREMLVWLRAQHGRLPAVDDGAPVDLCFRINPDFAALRNFPGLQNSSGSWYTVRGVTLSPGAGAAAAAGGGDDKTAA